MIYFDNAATTRVSEAAANAALGAMCNSFGNPSSLHNLGIEAEQILKKTREALADSLGADKSEFIFTSGGTEGNNLAIFGAVKAKMRRGKHIITSSVEHASVLAAMRVLENDGFRVTYLKPEDINVEGVLAAICEDTIFISLMSVNNELGACYPILDIANAIKRINPEILVHTDAVQAFLKIPINLNSGMIDLLTLSGHKIHAAKGVGALYIRRGVRIKARTFGGGQEKELRPGTENVPAIASLGAAVKASSNSNEMRNVLNYLREKLMMCPKVEILYHGEAPHILSIAIPGYPSEVAMRMLESRGIYVSSGSACSKGRRSHVLEAYRIASKLIDCAIRVSISDESTTAQADEFVSAIEELF